MKTEYIENVTYKLAYRIIRAEPQVILKRNMILDIPSEVVITEETPVSLLEDYFEDKRLSYNTQSPSRKSCLYIFPYSDYWVDRWTKSMFPHMKATYFLLTLQLNGLISWHDANLFTISGINPAARERSAKEYWSHCFNSDSLVEGLFKGNAILVDFEKREIEFE